ncbi:hypothetical protein E9O_03844 [Moraxella catarrhalis 12P80B1]|nr:hypothetical protein E9O_03844 [Moraxella catarrhalis 12P80B1]
MPTDTKKNLSDAKSRAAENGMDADAIIKRLIQMIKLKLVSNTVRGLSLSKKPRNLSEN